MFADPSGLSGGQGLVITFKGYAEVSVMLPLNCSFTYECNIMFKVSIDDGEMFVPYAHIFSKEQIGTYKS